VLAAPAAVALALAGLVYAQQSPSTERGASAAGGVPERPAGYANPSLPVTSGSIPARGVDPGSLAPDAAAGTTLPNWSGSFVDQGATYSYTMLGTDPSPGSATTTISVVLIPLKLEFSDGTVLDATAPAFGETKSATQLTQQSPLFQSAPFLPGGTNVGTTQYIDAFQRANFWNIVNATAPNYHVKFHVTTKPVQTLKVPAYFGYTVAGPGDRIGYIDFYWWDGELGVLLYRLGIKTNTLPIFLNYNILEYSSNFTYAGYHTAFGSPAQVYISAGFYDQGVFSYGGDIVYISHELGEATDDPFGGNIVPNWSNPQSPGSCSNLLEVGDPVSDRSIGTVVLNGYTYHPEDLAFLPWFSGGIPSTSVNGWYTFGNNYSSPATCN
jgi:hypothetical protein